MKRLITIFALLLITVACSNEQKIHKDIREGLVKDSLQVLKMIENAIENNESIDEELVEKYREVYYQKYDSGEYDELTEPEEKVFFLTYQVADQAEGFMLLDSGKDEFQSMKDNIIHVIKHGDFKPYEK